MRQLSPIYHGAYSYERRLLPWWNLRTSSVSSRAVLAHALPRPGRFKNSALVVIFRAAPLTANICRPPRRVLVLLDAGRASTFHAMPSRSRWPLFLGCNTLRWIPSPLWTRNIWAIVHAARFRRHHAPRNFDASDQWNPQTPRSECNRKDGCGTGSARAWRGPLCRILLMSAPTQAAFRAMGMVPTLRDSFPARSQRWR